MQSSHPMHVHLYQVSRSDNLPSFEAMIQNVADHKLEDRLRQVSTHHMRMEEAIPPGAKRKLWRLSFCKFRNDGPGRASREKPAESIPLAANESFSEDTAALYDPDSKMLVLQYNHYGPRAPGIEDYFTLWAGIQHEKYSFLLKINQAAQARLNNKKLFTRLQFKIAPDKLSDHWKKANVGLATAFKRTAQICDGDWINVEIGLDSQEHNASLDVLQHLKAFIGLADEPREAVSKLIIAGREDLDMAVDPVNLLNERVQRTYKGLSLDEGRRVPMEVRWNCLYDSYTLWKQSGLF